MIEFNLSEKRKEIREELKRLHKLNLNKDYISYGDFLRVFDTIKNQDEEFIKKLKEELIDLTKMDISIPKIIDTLAGDTLITGHKGVNRWRK